MARRWPSGHGWRGWGALSWSTVSVLVRSGAADYRGEMVRPAFFRGQSVTLKVGIRHCAIYTRKSSEEGLEQDFNSLHAQREACEAFIRSQRGEGWRLVETGYDDGGLSGGTLERPALRQLFADIAQHRVDTVVVYKVDRLTRSLMDFAKIVELFDRHAVSFVAVTQQFNTTTSMGRLTLNILLSFAQFEREVIGERVRDKIAASKKKGMWMGGIAPLGYAIEHRKLVILREEAETVRLIFARYRELRLGAAAQGRPRSTRGTIEAASVSGRDPCRRAALLSRCPLCAVVEPDLCRGDRAQGRPLSRSARGHPRSRHLGPSPGAAPYRRAGPQRTGTRGHQPADRQALR